MRRQRESETEGLGSNPEEEELYNKSSEPQSILGSPNVPPSNNDDTQWQRLVLLLGFTSAGGIGGTAGSPELSGWPRLQRAGESHVSLLEGTE